MVERTQQSARDTALRALSALPGARRGDLASLFAARDRALPRLGSAYVRIAAAAAATVNAEFDDAEGRNYLV